MIINKQKKYKNKITCFTVNIFDNGYYKDGLLVDEVNRKIFLNNINAFSNVFDFKIFDYTHPLVIECKEKYKEFFNREDIQNNIKADVIRLYILSKLPYHLYIDDDTILCKDFEIEDEEIAFFSLYACFCCIYNGNSLDVFKEMLEIYPFDDKQLKNKKEGRLDYILFENIYKRYKKFINKDLKINHYSKTNLVENLIKDKSCKNVIITEDENFDFSWKEDTYFIELCKKNKPQDNINYCHFCVNEKYYTKEKIIEMYKETGMVDKIVEENAYTKIILKR